MLFILRVNLNVSFEFWWKQTFKLFWILQALFLTWRVRLIFPTFSQVWTQGNVFSLEKLHSILIRINMLPRFPFRTFCVVSSSVLLVRFRLEETRKRNKDNPAGSGNLGSSREWLCCCAGPWDPHERTVRESDLQWYINIQINHRKDMLIMCNFVHFIRNIMGSKVMCETRPFLTFYLA